MRARTRRAKRRRTRRTRRARRGAGVPRWPAILAVGIAVLLLGVAGYQVVTWPDVAALRADRPETTAFIELYRERQRAAGADPSLDWRWVPYERIAPHLKRAVLVAEDINFFSHEGFAVDELRNALSDALRGEGMRGASTITQQLAKNLWLSPSRSPLRKAREALLASQLEEHLTKRRILELYLNVAEFGPGIYGAEAAAHRYFGRPAAELGEREAAQLAAVLPRPGSWNPRSRSRYYRARVERILHWMERADFLWRLIRAEPPESRLANAGARGLRDTPRLGIAASPLHPSHGSFRSRHSARWL